MGYARHSGFALLLVLLLAAVATAQSPCETPITTEVMVNPTKVAAQLPEYDLKTFDGTYAVPSYRIDFYAEGASQATQTATMPRESWALVPDTTPACYTAKLPSVPMNPWVKYTATLVAVGATGDVSPASNSTGPFGLAPRPAMVPVLRVYR